MLKQDDQQGLLDGMDVALCHLHQETGRLTFAGARRPLYSVVDGVLTELKGDRTAVGGRSLEQRPRHFTPQHLTLMPGMMLYLVTDGFADQPNSQEKSLGRSGFSIYSLT
ncbi:MAG: SpoIIE family protein phosphatase [Acidobacteriota bacterium]